MHVLMNALQAGNRSGTGRYTIELTQALCARPGLAMSVVWPQSLGLPGFPAGHVLPRPDDALARIIDDQFRMGGLRRACRADLIHYPANVGPLFGNTPFVLTVHDLSFLRHPEWFPASRAAYYRHTVLRTARRAARVITVSAHAKQDLIEIGGIPEDQIDVIHNGVRPVFKPAHIDAQAEAIDVHELPDNYFVYAGTLEPRKNLARLVRAWDRTAAEHPFDLVLVGREGWKLDAFLAAIVSSKHRPRIHRLDYLPEDELIAVISAARAFLWPSLFEGFGLPPLEAMACGTPVLTSNTSSLPEVCGNAAVMVDPLDEEAIASGIRRFATDLRHREDYRLRGRARAKLFTWDAAAEKTAATYHLALNP